MSHSQHDTPDTTYVIGCLYFCYEALRELGHLEYAADLKKICENLLGGLDNQDDRKLRIVVSNG